MAAAACGIAGRPGVASGSAVFTQHALAAPRREPLLLLPPIPTPWSTAATPIVALRGMGVQSSVLGGHLEAPAGPHLPAPVALAMLSSLRPGPTVTGLICRRTRRRGCLAQLRAAARSAGSSAARTTTVAASTVHRGEKLHVSPMQQLRVLLRAASKSGRPPPATLCNQLMQGCAASEPWPAVWELAQQAESVGTSLDPSTYTALWRAAIQAGWVGQGVQLFRRAAAVWGVHDQRAYTTIISALLRQRHRRGLAARRLAYQLWGEAWEVHAASLDGGSFRAGIHACCAVGRMEEADRLMRWAAKQGVRVGRGGFNRLLAAHAERGDMAAATAVWARLKALYSPCIVAWNTLAAGFARLGNVAATKRVVDAAAAAGCSPDARTWSALVQAHVVAGDLPGAEAVVAHVLQLQQQMPQQRGGRPMLSVYAYASLVDGYMRARNVAAAEAVLRRMYADAGLLPNGVIYSTLIRGYCKLGMAGQARALELLADMRRGTGGLPRPGPEVFTTLIDALGTAPSTPSDSDSVHRTAAASSAGADAFPSPPGPTPQTREQQPAAQMMNGHMQMNGAVAAPERDVTTAAVQQLDGGGTMKLMRPRPPTPVPDQAPAAAESSDSSEARVSEEVSQQRPSLVGHGPAPSLARQMAAAGLPLDAAVLTALMVGHARAGRTDQALAVAEELEASGEAAADPIAWAALAAVHAGMGSMAQAATAAERSAAAAAALGQPPPQGAYGALMHAHARSLDLPATLAALKRFLVLGGRPGPRIVDVVVRLCLRCDRPDAMLKVLRAVELTGSAVDRARYAGWLDEWRREAQAARRPPSPQAEPRVLERLKWWLGLPNQYYQPHWRDDAGLGPGSQQGSGRQWPSSPPPHGQQQQQQQQLN